MKNIRAYIAGSFIKHPVLSIILILQVALTSFIIFSSVFSYYESKEKEESISNAFSDSKQCAFQLMRDVDETSKTISRYNDIGETGGKENDELWNNIDSVMTEMETIDEVSRFYYFLNHLTVGSNSAIISEFIQNISEEDADTEYGIITEISDSSAALRSYYVDKDFVELFGLAAENGVMFSDKDYDVAFSDEIPIVMGNRFSKYFNVGDTFEGVHLFYEIRPITYKVIGFLPERTAFTSNGRLISLDNTVLYPIKNYTYAEYLSRFPNADMNLAFPVFQNITDTKFIVKDADLDKVIKEAEQITAKYGLSDYFKLTYSKYSPKQLADNYKQMFMIRIWCFFITAIFSFMTIVISMLYKISGHMKNYAIHILTGSTVSEICVFGAVEVIIYCSLGYMIGLCSFISVYSSYISLAIYAKPSILYGSVLFFIYAAASVFAVSILSVIKIHSYDISMLIRGNEVKKKSSAPLYAIILFILFSFVSVSSTFCVGCYMGIVKTDIYSRGFFTENTYKIGVNPDTFATSEQVIPELDVQSLGTDIAVNKWVTISANELYPIVRGIYLNGSYEQPEMIEGRFFTEDEMLEDLECIAVVGKNVFDLFGKTLEDGTKVVTFYEQDYMVLGIMGFDDRVTGVDDIMFIPLILSMNKFGNTGTFTVDGINASKSSEVASAFAEQMGDFADVVKNKVQIGALISAPTDAVVSLIILLILNTAVYAIYFADSRKKIITVKKVLGYSQTMVFCDLFIIFAEIAAISFIFGNLIMTVLSKTILSAVKMFQYYTINISIVSLSFLAVILTCCFFTFISLVKTYRNDTSEFIR